LKLKEPKNTHLQLRDSVGALNFADAQFLAQAVALDLQVARGLLLQHARSVEVVLAQTRSKKTQQIELNV
jgi:hypothetical protein